MFPPAESREKQKQRTHLNNTLQLIINNAVFDSNVGKKEESMVVQDSEGKMQMNDFPKNSSCEGETLVTQIITQILFEDNKLPTGDGDSGPGPVSSGSKGLNERRKYSQ